MGRIMDVFDAEFLNFRELCDGLDLTAEINYKTYPPKMVVRRLETLLDAAEDESEETAIVIAGGIEQEIMVKGEFALRKKELDSIIRKGIAALNIWLHAYVQDHMEYDAARAKEREA